MSTYWVQFTVTPTNHVSSIFPANPNVNQTFKGNDLNHPVGVAGLPEGEGFYPVNPYAVSISVVSYPILIDNVILPNYLFLSNISYTLNGGTNDFGYPVISWRSVHVTITQSYDI